MKKLLVISAILVFIDQITKYLMTDKKLFEGFVSLSYATNKGAAFGMLQGWKWLFIIVTIAVIIGIFYYYKDFKRKVGLVLLLAGAIGNLIDRVFLGYVRDFIAVRYFSTFNLADAFNVIGVGLIIYFYWKDSR
jgi:signal peptidase II